MNLTRRHNPWMVLAVCLVLAGLSWLAFGQTLTYDFINLDDQDYVLNNPHVARGLTSSGIAWAFTHAHAANWHPITWISHMIDCQLYGLNPRGHHLTNVILHAAVAISLFLVLLQMTQAFWRSALVAAIFVVHPLRAESVAWVSERKDVLSGLFFMLTLAAYAHYARQRSRLRYLVTLLLFLLGLMCKPMLVTVPFILLLLDYWPLHRFAKEKTGRLILEKIPFVALSIAASVATFFAQTTALVEIARLPILIRLGNAITSYALYLRQMLWPANLAAFYPFPPRGVSQNTFIVALILLIAISAVVFVCHRRRYLTTGWLWYLFMLAPVIGIIQVGEQSHADRYTYLPGIGIWLALVWLAGDLCARWRVARYPFAILAAAGVAALVVTTRAEIGYWRNSELLWRHALAVTNDNAAARRNLGHALYGKGELKDAMANYERALEFDPKSTFVHANMGITFLAMGRHVDAVWKFRTALELDPKYSCAECNLGLALFELGDVENSITHLRKAIELDPDSGDAHYNLGNSYLDLGRATEAIAEYEKAVALNPADERALGNMAWILATWPRDEIRNGQLAVVLAERADSLTEHTNPVISGILAAAYAETGRFGEATKAAERAIQLSNGRGNEPRAKSLQAQLELYQAGSPYRDQRFSEGNR